MVLETFNLDDFRLRPLSRGTNLVAKPICPVVTQSIQGESWFLKGPVPGEWLSMAAALPGKALHVAVAIWFLRGLTKSDLVKVTRQTRDKFSLQRDAYLRGLKQLEQAGLVRVNQKPGACAAITIQPTPQNTS